MSPLFFDRQPGPKFCKASGRKRRVLLLEALIAMALLITCLGMLLRGPVLLSRMEAKAWRDVCIQWEIDRQFLYRMACLLAEGPGAVPVGETVLDISLDQGSVLRATVFWTIKESGSSTSGSTGKRYTLECVLRGLEKPQHYQRSLFVRQRGP
jgi:hypothetical protein